MKIVKNKDLDKLGYGGKVKVLKEKESRKSKGKVLISKTGDPDENFYLR